MITLICDKCGKSFISKRHPSGRHAFCSQRCYHLWNSGELNPKWKGNDIANAGGYTRANKLFKCPPGYERHHIDGNPKNNDPSNILIVTRKEHRRIDGRTKKNIDRLNKYSQSPKGRIKSSQTMKLWWRKKKNAH